MMNIKEIIIRIKFWMTADRNSQDNPLNYWRLYFKSTMLTICKKKFKSFGANSEFRPGAYAEACSKISIGNNVVIRPGTFLFADPRENGGSIIIEDKVMIGTGAQFHTNNHKYTDVDLAIYDQGYPEASKADSIILKKGCWVGAGVIVLAGVTIGKNAVIGAGSVVHKSVPDYSVAIGNPAKIVRMLK